MGDFSERGPYHADINWDQTDGSPRSPFEVLEPPVNPVPVYPILWDHDAKLERTLIVESDSEGRIKAASGSVTAQQLREKAGRIKDTATRAHYNRDLRFNSQSLIVAMTEKPCIGGRSWPSVILEDSQYECAFALWCNSSPGLPMHRWMANKTQSGRGTTTVTSIPNIPTLDVRQLTKDQVAAAATIFEEIKNHRFLPFDQIDEDPAREELDRRLLVEVLNLPEWVTEVNGPIDLLRRKLASEPRIHGRKKKRVVFYERTDSDGNIILGEKDVNRDDR